MNIQNNIDLQDLHTFKVPAISTYFTTVESISEAQSLHRYLPHADVSVFVLGAGSNTLFTRDFAGLVVQNKITGITTVKETDQHIWIKVGAGENWHEFVQHAVEHGYFGIENLSLIPGTVGAAPIQNIGAYGVEIQDVFDCLTAVDILTGERRLFNHDDCDFSYRNSIFKQELKNKIIITDVTLKLHKTPQYNLSYAALNDHLKHHKIDTSLINIHQAVMDIRNSKLPDPNLIPNAGSFFKNPTLSQEAFSHTQLQFPHCPHHKVDNNSIKIPAAWLIEQCNFKGARVGDAGCHSKQPLVLINHGQASGQDIADLAHSIQRSVQLKFNIQLEKEVNII